MGLHFKQVIANKLQSPPASDAITTTALSPSHVLKRLSVEWHKAVALVGELAAQPTRLMAPLPGSSEQPESLRDTAADAVFMSSVEFAKLTATLDAAGLPS